MKNRYKIDVNSYISGRHKYALFVKRPWRLRWEHLESFETVQEAKSYYETMMNSVPWYL